MSVHSIETEEKGVEALAEEVSRLNICYVLCPPFSFYFTFRLLSSLLSDCLRVDAYDGFAVVTQNPSLYDTSDLTRGPDLIRC